MTSNISFNPFLTSNGAGSFSVQSDGYMQGVALDDPSIRNALAGGYLASTETLPMWGGVALQELIHPSTTDGSLGNSVGRATTNARITGFSVFNQAHAWVTSPQSQAPSAAAGMTIPFYRLGSGARIAVALDPSLVSLDGGLITQNVTWDINAQRLTPYDAATATYSVTSMTPTDSGGVSTIAIVMAVPALVGGVGDSINISGAVNGGTGGNGLVNGNFLITAFTDTTHFSIQVPAVAGAIASITGTIVLNETTGALACKILDVNIGTSKIITFDSVNNYVNWATGSTAIIQI